jgi:uncharacterized glyoxalase superfamily protein PhnB
MVADEFPELDVVSPQTMGGPSTVLHLYTEDVDALWARAVDAGAQALYPLQDEFWRMSRPPWNFGGGPAVIRRRHPPWSV